jgi:DNA-binding transcriptional MerR regulator
MSFKRGDPLQQRNLTGWYRAREFAELAGVTVRTLHHYDRLGLLKPRKRSAGGYRLYQMQDLARVEQIVALKFLGLPLAQIRRVLDEEPLSFRQELARQQAAQTKNFRTGQLFHARNASSDSASLEIVLPRCRRP